MKKIIQVSASVLISLLVMACGPSKEQKELAQRAKKIFGTLPAQMPKAKNDTLEQIALGKDLYFEKALSINDTQSCNSCHMLNDNKAGVDNQPTSPGAEGKFGDRNSPTVLNAGFHIAQFWDGRAKDLVEQAKGPILNPIEMGLPSEKIAVDKIKSIKEYEEKFKKAFPDSNDPITYQNIAEAIAAFERTLITSDKFDRFQNGDYSALNKSELAGLDTFIKTGCVQCHIGPLLGATSYRKMGQINPYENEKDLGRYTITKKESDKYVFKVPSLRNIELTGPYFHDGKTKKLEDAVRKMAWYQLNQKLADIDVKNIVAFLKTLSDEERK